MSPRYRLALRKTTSIRELGLETFIAHNVVSPDRNLVLRALQKHTVPLNMNVEMPTVERSAHWSRQTKAWRSWRGCAWSRRSRRAR